MKAGGVWPGQEDRIRVDEVGIAYGSVGRCRLRATFRPIFQREEGRLERVASEGGTIASIAGETVPLTACQAELPASGLVEIERLRLALQLRNMHLAGSGEGEVLLDLEPLARISRAAFPEQLAAVMDAVGQADVDPVQVICMLPACLVDGWQTIAATLRRCGAGVAMDGFGTAGWSEAMFREIRPDIVRADADWFGQVCRFGATVRLFGTLVDRLQEEKARVLVACVDTPEGLAAALKAGVSLVQGGLLGGHEIAGVAAGDEALKIADLCRAGGGTVRALL